MLEADIEDSAQREGIVLSSEDSGLFGSEVMINSFNQNDIRLHKAQHLAIGMSPNIMFMSDNLKKNPILYLPLIHLCCFYG